MFRVIDPLLYCALQKVSEENVVCMLERMGECACCVGCFVCVCVCVCGVCVWGVRDGVWVCCVCVLLCVCVCVCVWCVCVWCVCVCVCVWCVCVTCRSAVC